MNSKGASNNALAVSALITSAQSISKQASNNNIYFLFTNNSDESIYGSSTFLTQHQEYVEDIDYILTFDAKGKSGELLIYNTSSNNNQLINFYDKFASAKSGYSTLTNNYKQANFSNTQLLSLAMFNESQYNLSEEDTYLNLDKDSKNNYFNTVDELVNGATIYQFSDNSTSVSFMNYLDGFIVFNSNHINIIFIITLLVSLISIVFVSKKINFKKIGIIFTMFIFLAIISLTLSILPLTEIFKFANIYSLNESSYTPYTVIHNNVIITVITSIIILCCYIYTILIHQRFRITIIDYLFSILFFTLLCNFISIMFLKDNNVIFSITSILLALMTIVIKLKPLQFNKFFNLYLIIIIPIIVSTTYYSIILTSINNLIILTLLISFYTLLIIPFMFLNNCINYKIIIEKLNANTLDINESDELFLNKKM